MALLPDGRSGRGGVIAARHCGLRVFAMCVITNAAGSVFDESYKNDENDVVEAADAASHRMQTIFRGLIRRLEA